MRCSIKKKAMREELELGLMDLRDRINYLSRKSLNHDIREGDNPYRCEIDEIQFAIKMTEKEIKRLRDEEHLENI